jgi:hypothetical protein
LIEGFGRHGQEVDMLFKMIEQITLALLYFNSVFLCHNMVSGLSNDRDNLPKWEL